MTAVENDGYGRLTSWTGALILLSLALFATACGAAKSRDAMVGGCKLGDADDCLEAARMYEKGVGGRKSLSVALWYYENACRKGAIAGCQRAGEMWESGEGAEKSPKKAQEYYDKAKALSDE